MSAKKPFKEYEKLPESVARIGEVAAMITANNRQQDVGLRFAIFLAGLGVVLAIGAWAFAAWVR